MNRFARLAVVLGLLGAVGCGKTESSTAPSKDPAKPNTPRKLSVKAPSSQTVTQDRADELTVSVDRDGFSVPVTIELKNLPKGVTVETKDLTIPADKNSLKVTIKAAPDAPAVVDHVVQVVGKAKGEADVPEVASDFKLTVKSK
ncbi:hypothetical protein GobsT_56000 [Gemmata obscuriglobus]|uniref:Lipoprotein n=1 Tax=Gemmata obscuriglobus TaxID=114 RepID=A0A2Z3H0E9_9BACT|nr:hypothetical protein [Gemmata obscuriglobus]AWM36585.1 hypothetical protein C1280_05790 [Gemmata obscuriglobus]QEG30788.1 hypothetical protein GobsT_56000 [Gemmata obscuriglobus]VTS10119.1 unnamed protein product [Gemmata obscuriglobus UQM 2246]